MPNFNSNTLNSSIQKARKKANVWSKLFFCHLSSDYSPFGVMGIKRHRRGHMQGETEILTDKQCQYLLSQIRTNRLRLTKDIFGNATRHMVVATTDYMEYTFWVSSVFARDMRGQY